MEDMTKRESENAPAKVIERTIPAGEVRARWAWTEPTVWFERGYKWASKKSIGKLRDTIRSKSKRANGHSMECIIANINKTLKGWFEYFKHSHRTTFPRLDKWIRMRLRSILRKRRKRKGRGRGKDHQLWPNAWFADRGLFSLMAAQESVSQSLRR